MNCSVFLDEFEKNIDISLAPAEKQEFCEWVDEQADRLNLKLLLDNSPESVSSKLRKLEIETIKDTLEILIDVYVGSCLLE